MRWALNQSTANWRRAWAESTPDTDQSTAGLIEHIPSFSVVLPKLLYASFTPFLKYQMKPNTQVMYIYKHKHKHEEYISFHNKQHENQTKSARTTENERGIEGMVTGGGYGSEGEVDTEYRCQAQPEFRGKDERNNIIRT